MSLDAAFAQYWNERGRHSASAFTTIHHCGKDMIANIGSRTLDAIGDAELNKYVAKCQEEGLSNSTINRRLDVLRAIYSRAASLWGVDTGTLSVGKHRLPMPENRTRWITPKEADALIMAAAPHLKAPIRCALLTGLRLDNIVNMQWEQVDMDARVIRMKVKSSLPGRKSHEIPISDALFYLLVEQQPQKTGHVFLRRFKPNRRTGEVRPPEPVKKFRTSFRTACTKAKIDDFRFHDLRHTAASWMVQNGVPLDVVKDILGHSDISMTMKYAHRDAKAKFDAVNMLGQSQIGHTNKKGKKHAI